MTGQVIDDWDDEVPVVAAATVYEDDEVLDDWDAEEKVVEMAPAKVEIPKKSKPVKKETLIHEDMYVNESEADRKKRIEEAVRIRDLESAMSLFGVDSVTDEGATAVKERNTIKINASHFDTMNPNTLTEFDQFSKIIVQRLQTFEEHKSYPMFVETLINGIMTRRTVPEIRKIAGVLTDLAALKMREKSNAGKAAALASNSSGGKNAPSLKSAKKGSSGRFDDCFAVEDDYDCFGE